MARGVERLHCIGKRPLTGNAPLDDYLIRCFFRNLTLYLS